MTNERAVVLPNFEQTTAPFPERAHGSVEKAGQSRPPLGKNRIEAKKVTVLT